MTMKRNYSGYRIVNRSQLLADLAAAGITPQFEHVICEHVTHRYPDDQPAPPLVTGATAIAHIAGDGIEALVVAVDSRLDRPDGKAYHVTLSHAEDRKPVESNDLIANAAREQVRYISISIDLEPF